MCFICGVILHRLTSWKNVAWTTNAAATCRWRPSLLMNGTDHIASEPWSFVLTWRPGCIRCVLWRVFLLAGALFTYWVSKDMFVRVNLWAGILRTRTWHSITDKKNKYSFQQGSWRRFRDELCTILLAQVIHSGQNMLVGCWISAHLGLASCYLIQTCHRLWIVGNRQMHHL